MSIAPAIAPLALVPRADARVELGIAADAIVVGWLARMIPVKAPQLVVELARALPDVTFVMGGGGPLLDTTAAAAPPNLHVLGWMPAELIYGAADFALLTSVSEGMPVALIEAQMAGLPVVCTDVGSTSEVVANEQTGLVVHSSGLSAAVQRLATDPALRMVQGAAAAERARALFSPQNMVTAHLCLYERLLARP